MEKKGNEGSDGEYIRQREFISQSFTYINLYVNICMTTKNFRGGIHVNQIQQEF